MAKKDPVPLVAFGLYNYRAIVMKLIENCLIFNTKLVTGPHNMQDFLSSQEKNQSLFPILHPKTLPTDLRSISLDDYEGNLHL